MDNVDNRPEAFFGLIAPIGVDLGLVQTELSSALERVSFNPKIIKLTDFLREHSEWFDLGHTSEFQRYEKFIEAGNRFCQVSGRRDALAVTGIAQIYRDQSDRPNSLSGGTAYIFRQLKRVEEVKTLREVYGSNIVFLGCYSPKRVRVRSLVSLLLKSARGSDRNTLEAQALQIIGVDENQKDVSDGQRFLDAYPHSDFIIDCTDPTSIRSSIQRLIECFFGYPFVSPTRDEHGMYLAQSASLRSTDLSRQVGAAIFGENREIVSLGCNEVPSFGGGTYWVGDRPDGRDFQLGYDSNARIRADMIRDLLDRLRANWLNEVQGQKTPDQLSREALWDDGVDQGPLARAMIADVIEYGRMVHAEMNAITDAARFGRATRNGTLYCTTLPCHMCTKLIVASGITEVKYLQPYYKSLVSELYEDSVAIDETLPLHVKFNPFIGVTPNGFRMVFEKGRRKDEDDQAVRWSASEAMPLFTTGYPSYLNTEANVLRSLEEMDSRMKSAFKSASPGERDQASP
ncbi:MAG TPA: deaminase [Allosphingosinicella sp.]|nr:deaminase [Allosphingosinicella sp.]